MVVSKTPTTILLLTIFTPQFKKGEDHLGEVPNEIKMKVSKMVYGELWNKVDIIVNCTGSQVHLLPESPPGNPGNLQLVSKMFRVYIQVWRRDLLINMHCQDFSLGKMKLPAMTKGWEDYFH